MQINTYDGSMWASTPTARVKICAKRGVVYYILKTDSSRMVCVV